MAEKIYSSVTSKQRFQRANIWLRSLDELRTQLPEGQVKHKVAAVERFILDNTQIGTPFATSDGEQWGLSVNHLENGQLPKANFVPLFMADLALHQYFRDITIPTYREELKTVFIPPCRVSSEWRGILMFHEFCHAIHHLENTFHNQEEAHWVEEVQVFEDEHAVLGQLFEEYDEKTHEAVAKMKASRAKNHNMFEVIKMVDWHKIFPAPQSHRELGLARTAFLLGVVYADINGSKKLSTKEKTTKKAAFTKQFYGEDKS